MKLDSLEQHWDALGEQDPLWAILSAPDKRGGSWNLDEFLSTGHTDVDDVLAELNDRGVSLGRNRVLDFGCGVGRLTQALADHFDHCDGVDLAASMVDLANQLNQRGARCRFHHNPSGDLHEFRDGSFDFVLCLLVLQHMEPVLMQSYLTEFVRVLSPDGVAYFNVPERYVLGTELAPGATRASIELIGSVPRLAPQQVVPLRLRVRNVSELPWPRSAQLVVGNHWLVPDGQILVHDDGRAAIDAAVAAGGACELELAVVAPGSPGAYELELDLVQEQIGWFAAKGSPTLRVAVSVEATGAEPEPSDQAVLAPRIEMHVMLREDVIATVEDAGGAVLAVIERERCGPLVPSFDYVIGRSRARRGPGAG